MSCSTLGSFLSQRFEPANTSYTHHDKTSSSTTSMHYSAEDITTSGWWDFSPEWVRNEYTEMLNQQRGNLPTSSTAQMSPQAENPLKIVRTESGFAEYASRTIFQDLNRAFGAVTEHEYPRLRDRTSWPEDRLGVWMSNNECRSTLVGELKVSWVFHSSFDIGTRNQPLSQLLHYLHKHELRYGYILTDCQFVAVRRASPEEYGSIESSDPVPWGKDTMIALWGLHMLASKDPIMPGLDRPEVPVDEPLDRDSLYID